MESKLLDLVHRWEYCAAMREKEEYPSMRARAEVYKRCAEQLRRVLDGK
jgi:hypothetical protein